MSSQGDFTGTARKRLVPWLLSQKKKVLKTHTHAPAFLLQGRPFPSKSSGVLLEALSEQIYEFARNFFCSRAERIVPVPCQSGIESSLLTSRKLSWVRPYYILNQVQVPASLFHDNSQGLSHFLITLRSTSRITSMQILFSCLLSISLIIKVKSQQSFSDQDGERGDKLTQRHQPGTNVLPLYEEHQKRAFSFS